MPPPPKPVPVTTGPVVAPAAPNVPDVKPRAQGDVITLRAARLIGAADDIVYDQLVGEGILELARPGARLHYVGKQRNLHTLPFPSLSRGPFVS